MLKLNNIISQGGTRACYQHPKDAEKCVKVFLKNCKAEKIFNKELAVYTKVKPCLKNFLCNYDENLVETDKGLGLVTELIVDDNGEPSIPLVTYLVSGKMNSQIITEINKFVNCIMDNNIFFYDFNLMNFVVQVKNGQYNLKYIDLKSYHRNHSWTYLKVERIFPPLAKKIMRRRLKRLYELLKLPRPI